MVKATVELIDLLGIYCTVTRVVNKGEMRIMVTAIGVCVSVCLYVCVVCVCVCAHAFPHVCMYACMYVSLNKLFY